MQRILKRTLAILLAALIAFSVATAAGAAADPREILTAGGNFEDAFKNWDGEWTDSGLSPIKMRLQGDTLTFDYSPVFYFADAFAEGPLTEAEIADIMEQCVAGFKRWEGVYQVYGRELTLEIDVHPGRANSLLRANVMVIPKTIFGTEGGMVPGAFLWRPYSPVLTMFLAVDYPQYTDFAGLAGHEFGHVLGLFDAYGYGGAFSYLAGVDLSWLGDWLLPAAPLERASYDSIMRGGGRDYVSPADASMLLWGWKNNRLQLYTDSKLTWLGAEVSQAFID